MIGSKVYSSQSQDNAILRPTLHYHRAYQLIPSGRYDHDGLDCGTPKPHADQKSYRRKKVSSNLSQERRIPNTDDESGYPLNY